MSRNVPLHSQLYEVMAERIRSGVWKEGDRVPSESALIDEFGTSRGPVRQALSRLRSEGLIVGGRGAPPRVQRAVPSQSFDTYLSFTEWAAELGAAVTQKTIEVARRLASPQIAAELEIPPGSLVVAVTRLRMLDGEPVMFERGWYTIEAGQHLLTADLDATSIYQVFSDYGIFPMRARNVIDAVAADPLEAEWLGVPIGSPLLRLHRITYDQHGKILDLAENRYLPNKATFVIENTRLNPTPFTRVAVGDESG